MIINSIIILYNINNSHIYKIFYSYITEYEDPMFIQTIFILNMKKIYVEFYALI